MGYLIWRADAIDAILGSFNAIRDIEELSAVDAVPVVHGRWIADSDGLPVCSICDEVAMQRLHCDTMHETWRYDVRLVKTHFCPNCGAKMDAQKGEINAIQA